MSFWIIKTEPNTYSFEDLKRDHTTTWDGVRNYQARNNLRLMKIGDLALVYHSVGPKELVGIAEVISTAFPDPTDQSGRWSAVDVKFVKYLDHRVTLFEVKANSALHSLSLVRQGRLSVAPVDGSQWRILLAMAKTKL
jgi:predicted RNA-binding protein with PUA-like domain